MTPDDPQERSIAKLVLHPGGETQRRRRDAQRALAAQPRPRADGPAHLVLFATLPDRGTRAAWASLATSLGLAMLAAIGATATGAVGPTPRPQPSQPTPQATLSLQHEVELPEPKPEPKPEPSTAKPSPTRPASNAPRTTRSPGPEPEAPAPTPSNDSPPAEGEPSPAAQAGDALTADAPDTLDFTGFDMTTGDGPRYAGGVTASSGRSEEAVHAPHVDPRTETGSGSGPGGARHAQPVRLRARSWSCPWPHQAETLGIDEQTVELRVTVEPNGHASKIRVTRNPGHGFASAATRCAREAHFEPARDARGRPVRAESPPIRVRFTR